MKKIFTLLAAVLFVGSMTATVNTGAKALSSLIHGKYVAETAELQAVSDSTTWDFSRIAANTESAFYSSDGIKLTAESTPNKDEEVVYANYSADYMTFGDGFDATTMAFKGEFPIRKNQYCQAGTLHFKAEVPGTIVVKFSDTGSSASASAVKRYLVVNGEQTEYWTSRPNNGEDSYEGKLNVTSDAIEVPAGDVTITGSSAIIIYFVTFVPAKAEGPKNLGEKTIAEFLDLKNTVDTCVLTGVVTSITSTTYGNHYLVDETDTVYVYGVLTPAGESKKFETLGVEEGDTLTIKAIYGEYKGYPQISNAIFVSVKDRVVSALDNIPADGKSVRPVKVYRDGMLLLEKNGRTYNVKGQMMK
ncbi:MAG: hypothetical protein IJ154_08335 [Bacteroidales bacterium]|nr:hypothetical protein [Bacteroidales bacterium]